MLGIRRLVRYMKCIVCSFLVIIGLTTEVSAWNDFGHMTIGAIAYDHLTPKVRTHVDALLRLNPSYQEWVAVIAEQDKRKVAFMKAATWPDMITTAGPWRMAMYAALILSLCSGCPSRPNPS